LVTVLIRASGGDFLRHRRRGDQQAAEKCKQGFHVGFLNFWNRGRKYRPGEKLYLFSAGFRTNCQHGYSSQVGARTHSADPLRP
jgi:hypothetical protein